jgi:hypothetical protein
LTGKYYDNSVPIQDFIKRAYLSKSSIPKVLIEKGFVVDIYPHIHQSIYFDKKVLSNIIGRENRPDVSGLLFLFDSALFRVAPHFIKRYILNDYEWMLKQLNVESKSMTSKREKSGKIFSDEALKKLKDLRFINDMVLYSRAESDTQVFKFYHLEGLHVPYSINEDLKFEKLEKTRINALRSSKGIIKYTKIFLEKLKELGIYDSSLIFIIADHGGYTDVASLNDEKPAKKSNALPLVLVKPIGEEGGLKITDAPVMLSDIPKTTFSLLGIDSGKTKGKNMFDIDDLEKRERKFYYFLTSNWNNDYVSDMREFIVDGHGWFERSWKKTKKTLSPVINYDPAERFHEVATSKNKYLREPEIYSDDFFSEPNASVVIHGWGKAATNVLEMRFSGQDPEEDDHIGITLPVEKLAKGHNYKASVEVYDSYPGSFPNRFEQRVFLGDKLIFKHDPAGADKFTGWNKVEHVFKAGLEKTELKVELKATGNPEKGWGWGINAMIGIREVKVEELARP